jgi:hypothetical protein
MFSFDARVRNPMAQPIWLIYEVNRGSPASVEIVSLDRISEGPPRFLWTFRGDGSMQAVRIAAHANVVVRGLEFSSSQRESMTLVLASDVIVDGRPAFEWMGSHEDLPSRGELDMRSLTASKARKAEPSERQAPVQIGVICTCQIDLWSEPIGKRRL